MVKLLKMPFTKRKFEEKLQVYTMFVRKYLGKRWRRVPNAKIKEKCHVNIHLINEEKSVYGDTLTET